MFTENISMFHLFTPLYLSPPFLPTLSPFQKTDFNDRSQTRVKFRCFRVSALSGGSFPLKPSFTRDPNSILFAEAVVQYSQELGRMY